MGNERSCCESTKKKKKNAHIDAEVKVEIIKQKKKAKGFLSSVLGLGEDQSIVESITTFINGLTANKTNRQEQLLVEICKKLENLNDKKALITIDKTINNTANKTCDLTIMDQNKTENRTDDSHEAESTMSSTMSIPRNDLYNPYWIDLKLLGDNDIYYLNTKEMTFWQGLLAKYLHPLRKDVDEEKRIAGDLIKLRNNSCFAFFMLNALWVVMQFQFEYVSMVFPNLIIPIGKLYNKPDQKVQLLGLVFLFLFTFILLLQFVSMLFHRWGTIAEILSSTRVISTHKKYRNAKLTVQEAVDLIKEMELEPVGKQDIAGSMVTSTTEDDSNQTDADFQTQQDDDDILPEPEPDYFNHPAVNNVNNWNHRYKEAMSPFVHQGRERHHDLNMSNVYHRNLLGQHGYNVGGETRFSNYPHGGNTQFDMNQNFMNQHNNEMFSPRQSHLRPLHNLDNRVMKQFRALERHDPRFRNTRDGYEPNQLASPLKDHRGFNV